MSASSSAGSAVDRELVEINVKFKVSGTSIEARLPVPTGPTRPVELLPILHGLTNIVMDIATKEAEAGGEQISCKKGCGACCRQLAPVTGFEARRLRDLVDEMPEPRQSQVKARFADVKERLQKAGLYDKLLSPEKFTDAEIRPLGLEYFQQGIPCPFLEEESCSIHPDRPIKCREYLVTSPAENCSKPTPESVHCIELPGKVSDAAFRIDLKPDARMVGWVPISLALDWAESHPDDSIPKAGPDLLRDVFNELTGARLQKQKQQ